MNPRNEASYVGPTALFLFNLKIVVACDTEIIQKGLLLANLEELRWLTAV